MNNSTINNIFLTLHITCSLKSVSLFLSMNYCHILIFTKTFFTSKSFTQDLYAYSNAMLSHMRGHNVLYKKPENLLYTLAITSFNKEIKIFFKMKYICGLLQDDDLDRFEIYVCDPNMDDLFFANYGKWDLCLTTAIT